MPVAFVEDKRPDLERVAALLEESRAANHWTNFGPVWRRLREHIEAALALPATRVALPCASGTHALAAAAALVGRDGPVRWVASCYGFRATVIGPFAEATVVDCDAGGLIDLGLVAALGTDAYDGIVATNPLGIYGDLDAAVEFARRERKALILDNAAAFKGFDRSRHDGVHECLSFHHTKPYGFGEGGCLILDRALEEEAVAALDFGYRWPFAGGQAALSNGKLSDPAAAFILDRHERDGEWRDAYDAEFRRVASIGERLGFRLLAPRERIGSGAHGNVPLLAPEAVPLERLENPKLKLLKYYKPLAGRATSGSLYARTVNVPCHPGVAALGDGALEGLLARLREPAAAGAV